MIDLVARLRLDDKFSKPMQRAMKAMDNAEKVSNKLARSTEKVGSSTSKMSRNFDRNTSVLGKHTKVLTGLVGGMAAVAGAYAAANASAKIFSATVGEAMKMEQSQVVIGAMFDNDKLSKQYMKMMDEMAINSPLLDSQTMYGNSKSFVALSKDSKQLEKMWKLAEKLIASDPTQGLEGAVLALREIFSGDAISIVERFEMNRDVMNDIKNLPLEQQLSRLDEYFNKLGFSDKLIADMGNTALGKWTQVKERWQLIMRDMGQPALKSVSEFLNNALDRLEGEPMQKFAQWGGKAIDSIVTGLSNGVVKVYDWFTALTNDPGFKAKTTLSGKIDFIVADIGDKLQQWYDDGGKKKIMDFGSDVLEVLIGILNNSDKFAQLGVNIGASLTQGIKSGIKNAALETTLGKAVDFIWGETEYEKNLRTKVESKYAAKEASKKTLNEQRRSRYHGIDYVPKNNWKADLHKGEAVLPAQEAKAWREGKSGSSSVVSINVANMNVREDGDIEKVAYQLAKYIESAAMQNG